MPPRYAGSTSFLYLQLKTCTAPKRTNKLPPIAAHESSNNSADRFSLIAEPFST
jgi:hypothetical protein